MFDVQKLQIIGDYSFLDTNSVFLLPSLIQTVTLQHHDSLTQF